MANRAYLLSGSSPEENIDFNDDGRRFYDSRWTMPLAWLFFFQTNDLFVFEKYPDPNIRFVANKKSACIYFLKKRRLISQIVKHIDIEEILDRFISNVESWNNREYLILRPDEVWGYGEFEEKDIPLIKNVLEEIDNEFATGDSVKSEIEKVPSSYIRTVFVEQERLSVDLIGCTYW